MISALTRRRSHAGFTLIELLIVVIIIGILIAIGVPAYLKYVGAANDRDAQAALHVAYKAAVAGDTEVNTSKFPVATTIVNDVKTDEPAASIARGSCLSAVATAPAKQVLVDPSSTSSQVILCDRSASGAIWKLSGPLTGTPSLSDGSTVAFTFSGNEIADVARAAKVQGDGLTNDSSTGVWEASTNLDTNGGSETSNAGWVYGVRSTAFSKFGAASLKAAAMTFPSDFTEWANTPPLSAGSTYTASIWALQTSGSTQTARVGIVSTGSTAGFSGSLISIPSGVWTRVSVTGVIPADGRTYGRLRFTPGSGTNVDWYLDGGQVEQKPYPTPYIETNGATASRADALVRGPVSLLNITQGWAAFRVRMDISSTDIGGSSRYLLLLGKTSTPQDDLQIRYRGASNTWRLNNEVNDVQTAIDSAVSTWTPGTAFDVVAAWTSTTLKIAVNGAPFVSVARAGIPNFDPSVFSTFSLGSDTAFGNPNIDADYFWFAAGTGTLTDADASLIDSWGNTDPSRSSFPSSAQASVVWDGSSATGSLK